MIAVPDLEFSEIALFALDKQLQRNLRQALVHWLRVTLRQRPWIFGEPCPPNAGGRYRVGAIGPIRGIRLRVWYEVRADESVMIWHLGITT